MIKEGVELAAKRGDDLADAAISADGLRPYRPPSFKPRRGTQQANFERRFEEGGPFDANGHLDIKGP